MNKVRRLLSNLLIVLLLFNSIAIAESANINPELIINNADKVNVVLGNIYKLDGYIKDQNAGDQLSLKYSIKKDGTVLQNHNSKELLSVASTSENQSINSMSIDVTGLAYGEYEVDLWVVDNQGASSSVITKTFVYSEMSFDPVIDKFNITQTTNNASFEYEGHSNQYTLIDKPYQINLFDNESLINVSDKLNGAQKNIDLTSPIQVVDQAYSTQGNGGRKVVVLDNGWVISCDKTTDSKYLRVDKQDGNGFNQLCFMSDSNLQNYDQAITATGNVIHWVFFNFVDSGDISVRFISINAVTQTDVNVFSSSSILGSVFGTSGDGAISIEVNEFSGKDKITIGLEAFFVGFTNSQNIGAIQGTISNDVVTWESAEQLTTSNATSTEHTSPTIVYNNDNQPVITHITRTGITNYILQNKKFNGSTWDTNNITTLGAHSHFNPSATFMPPIISTKINASYTDGLFIVAWHGADPVDTSYNNIRCKASSDNGITWFDFGIDGEKITTGNVYEQWEPSISWNDTGEIFISWMGQHNPSYSHRFDVFTIKRSLSGWNSSERITNTSSYGSSYFPSAMNNFHDYEIPLLMYSHPVGNTINFYGKWTVGEPGGTYNIDDLVPNTTYKSVLNVTNVLNNVSTMEKYFTTLAEVSVISEVSTSSDALTFKVLDNNAYRTGYKVYVNDEYVNMFGEISSNDSEWYRMSVDDLSGEKRFTVRGLTPGTEYTIRVKSRNHDGIETDLSNALVFTTSNVSPAGVVSSIASNATRETVSLSWDPVEYASSYIVKINDVTTEVNMNSLSVSSGDIAGLDIIPDTVYKVSVAAKNAVSTTEYSLPVTVKTLLPKPAVPSLSIVSSSNNSVSLSWPELSNVNRYELEVDGRLVDMHLDNFYKHTGLVKSSQHAYRIRSYNADGMSDWSPVIVVKTSASDVVGALQSGVEKKSNASITLSWDAVPNAVCYYVQLDEGDVLKSSGNLYTIFGGLKPSTSYHLRVYAGDEETYHPTAILDINTTTHLLSTPVIVNVPVDEKFKIDWDDIEGATSYEVVFNDDVNTLVTVSDSEYITDISSLENMNTVKVRAISSTGDSGYSNILSIILKEKLPISPNDLKYISGEDFVLLTWSDNDNSLYYDLEVDGAVIESIERDKYLHDGLTAFSEHKYRIRSKSEMMEGLWSQFLEIITLPTKPLPPSGVVIKNTRSTATLSWDEVPSAEGYEVKVNEDTVYKLGTQTTYTHRGIPLNKEQTYRVRTSNIIGESSWSHLIVNNSLRALCQRDSTIDLGLTASNVDDFSKYTLRVTYNPDVLEVTDLCGYTSDIELEAGHIESEDITVTEFEEVFIDGVKTGVITFKVSKPVEEGYSWTGILNNIKFNPKLTGITYLTYTVLIDEEKSGGHHE